MLPTSARRTNMRKVRTAGRRSSAARFTRCPAPAEGPVESEQVWGTIPLIPYVNGQPPAYSNPPSTGPAIGAISQVFNGQTVQFQQLGGYMVSEYEHVWDWIADYRVPIGRNNIDFSWTQSIINPDSGNDNHASGGGAY